MEGDIGIFSESSRSEKAICDHVDFMESLAFLIYTKKIMHRVYYSGEEKLLAVPSVADGTALSQAKYDTLEDWCCEDSVAGLCFDTTYLT